MLCCGMVEVYLSVLRQGSGQGGDIHTLGWNHIQPTNITTNTPTTVRIAVSTASTVVIVESNYPTFSQQPCPRTVPPETVAEEWAFTPGPHQT